MKSNNPRSLKVARAILLSGYFSLFTLLMCWYLWLHPSQTIPTFWVLLLFIGPLLIPLRGLIHARPRSYAWLLYLSLFYFIHGIGELFAEPSTRLLSILEIIFSTQLYLGALFTTRLINSNRAISGS